MSWYIKRQPTTRLPGFMLARCGFGKVGLPLIFSPVRAPRAKSCAAVFWLVFSPNASEDRIHERMGSPSLSDRILAPSCCSELPLSPRAVINSRYVKTQRLGLSQLRPKSLACAGDTLPTACQ